MLVGREQERQRLDELLQGLRRGRGGVLALIGEAGIGKTTLLRYAAERATGARVLTARGIESESELPFSGLFDLVRPLLDRIDRLPDAQGRALAAALAVGEPVAAERFAVAVATLSLLAAGADDAPIVAVVDDAQWLDASSLEAILFAARRLDAEAVLLLLAARSDLPGLAGIEQLELTGLEERAARVLVARGGVPVATPVAEALVRASRGNPLALVELSRLVDRGTAERQGAARGSAAPGSGARARFRPQGPRSDRAGSRGPARGRGQRLR
ncbi:MAG: ATP-binding protein [Actinobacteria bacterium]|nr:ATP-binding protein [Actinomycetota bacterium]